MATLRELIIKISANSQSFQTEIARASRMGQDYYRTMQNGGRQAAAAARESEQALSELTNGFASAGRAAAAATAAFATGEIVQIADEWTSVNARLKQASSSTDDFTNSQMQLMQISQRTGTAFTDNANLFARAAASMREFGYNSEDVLRVTEAVSTGLKISGASAEESGSVITQFSQALAQGVLRGEEFNAVNESGDRVVRALAAGMGVARKDLKAMADQGQLTIDKVVPAMISQLDTLRGEFGSMPQTVSGSMQKVTNSFMAWVGGVNQATGATDALSGGLNGLAGALDGITRSGVSGALDDVADNMSTITTVAGGLIGVGLAKYLGGIVSSATGATTSLISAAKAEVALAVAQDKAAQSSVAASRADVYRAQQALQAARGADVQAAQQEKIAAAEAKVTAAQTRLNAALAGGTATEKVRARAALERAQSGLAAAKNADVQTAAEKRLAAAQAALNRNLAGRVTTQNNLNSVTAVGTRLLGGAMGLIGGVPGLVMLGAGAWYALYQNQEQARQSARDYAGTIEEIRNKTREMSLPEATDNESKTREALKEQNRLISDQETKIRSIKDAISGYQQMLANPGVTINGYMVNHLTSMDEATTELANSTDALAVEQERLSQMQAKSNEIQSVLEGLEHRRVDLIRQQAAEQNKVYQSLLIMNGEHAEFNRLLGLGNNLLAARQGLANIPMRIPQADSTQQQKDALEKSRRDLELSRLKGEAKEIARLGYVADDLGLTTDPQYQNNRQALINIGLETWRNNEANKPQKKGPKTEAEKTEDIYKRLIKQQQEQIALAGQSTELAKVKYQVSQGELATLSQAQKAEVMRNASLIDQVKLREQLRAYEANLADSNASARTANQADLIGFGQGSRFRQRAQEMLNIRKDFEQKNVELQRQYQGGDITEDLYQKELALNKQYLAERLRDQQDFYVASDAQRGDWVGGMREGFADWADNASDYASQSAELVSSSMDSALDNVTAMLVGNKASWKDWGLSVLQTISKVALQMAVVNAMGGGSSGSGLFGSLLGGIAGGIAGGAAGDTNAGTAIQNYGASFQFNAKGGVYSSADLSSYSGSVVDTPTFFAFAKGAGVMGEAGPEAIMPLTRDATGRLGVKALGSGTQGGAGVSVSIGTINFTGGTGGAQGNANAAGAVANQLTGAIIDTINTQLRKPGTPLWNATQGKR
ncbi:TPA: phage tail tape measure protein [Cronobacter sakazakii]|nr:phage tail tape measure protein [Cronobacter sakazakii]